MKIVRSLTCLLLACAPPALAAQAYPSKPIRMITPFTTGGAIGLLGRSIGGVMAEYRLRIIAVAWKRLAYRRLDQQRLRYRYDTDLPPFRQPAQDRAQPGKPALLT